MKNTFYQVTPTLCRCRLARISLDRALSIDHRQSDMIARFTVARAAILSIAIPPFIQHYCTALHCTVLVV